MTETPPPYKPCGHDGTPYVEPRTGGDTLPRAILGQFGVCPCCGCEFGLPTLIRLDGREMPEDDTKLYECPVCNGHWPKSQLTRHHYGIVSERISKHDHLMRSLQQRSEYASRLYFGRKERERKP